MQTLRDQFVIHTHAVGTAQTSSMLEPLLRNTEIRTVFTPNEQARGVRSRYGMR